MFGAPVPHQIPLGLPKTNPCQWVVTLPQWVSLIQITFRSVKPVYILQEQRIVTNIILCLHSIKCGCFPMIHTCVRADSNMLTKTENCLKFPVLCVRSSITEKQRQSNINVAGKKKICSDHQIHYGYHLFYKPEFFLLCTVWFLMLFNHRKKF